MESISYNCNDSGVKKLTDAMVSIIIPVYNLESVIDRCLDSVLAQTWPNLEILVIDDGSYDQSRKIIAEYAKTDERVRLFSCTHAGVSSTRNVGIQKASGEYLLFVDGDDQIAPDMVEKYIDAFTEKDDIVLGGIRIRETGISEIVLSPDPGTCSRKEFIKKLCNDTSGLYGYTAGKMYRRSLIDHYHLLFPLDMNAQEDLSFALSVYAVAEHINCICYAGYYYFRAHIRRQVPVIMLIRNQMKLFDLASVEGLETDKVARRIHDLVYTAAYHAKDVHQINELIKIPGLKKYLEKHIHESNEKKFVIKQMIHDRGTIIHYYFRCRAFIRKCLIGRKENA